MYKAVILALARNDIRDAAKWYNTQQDKSGKRFTEKVRQKVQAIIANPYAFSIRYSNIRTVNTDIFPFMIHYTVIEDTKTVLISAVLHTSLDPEKWAARAKD